MVLADAQSIPVITELEGKGGPVARVRAADGIVAIMAIIQTVSVIERRNRHLPPPPHSIAAILTAQYTSCSLKMPNGTNPAESIGEEIWKTHVAK